MEVKKIGEIKAELEAVSIEGLSAFIETYKKDDRGGVQKIVVTAEKRLEYGAHRSV